LSDIRVTYSGLIAFAIGMLTVFTGLVFVLFITRSLSPEEFGTWSVIGGMVSYFLISERIISFWTTRQIARGENVGKTSITSSAVLSIGVIPIYFALSYAVHNSSDANLDLLWFGSLLLPCYLVSQTLNSINMGHKPQAKSYGNLILEITKIPAALLLVVIFDLGVIGAITALVIAYITKIAGQIYFAREKIKEKLSVEVIKRWFRLSWLPLYAYFSTHVLAAEIVLFSILAGSLVSVAFYSVSFAIAGIMTHAAGISQALYPKLLAKGSPNYIIDTLVRLLFFAIPLLGIIIIFSKPGLFALNPEYQEAWIIVILLGFRQFFYIITEVFYGVLLGLENVDVEHKPKFSMLIKSKLFQIPTIRAIHFTSYLVTFAVVMLILTSYDVEELDLVSWWASLSLAFEIPFFIYSWILVKKHVKISFPFTTIAKYIGAALIMIVIYLITSDWIIKYEISIYKFLPGVIIEFVICAASYLLITYFIDKRTRSLFKAIITELTSRGSK